MTRHIYILCIIYCGIYLHSDSKLASVVVLSGGDKDLAKSIAMHVAASNPLALDSEGISQEILNKEKELITEELKNSGKPDDIVKKISLGKINKFKEENSLMTQQWVMEPKKKVQDIINELAIKDLKIIEFYRIKIGD